MASYKGTTGTMNISGVFDAFATPEPMKPPRRIGIDTSLFEMPPIVGAAMSVECMTYDAGGFEGEYRYLGGDDWEAVGEVKAISIAECRRRLAEDDDVQS